MKTALEQQLSLAKEEYEKRKQFFLLVVNNEIETAAFEKNAISDLMVMLEIKTQIKTLEKEIQLLNILDIK